MQTKKIAALFLIPTCVLLQLPAVSFAQEQFLDSTDLNTPVESLDENSALAEEELVSSPAFQDFAHENPLSPVDSSLEVTHEEYKHEHEAILDPSSSLYYRGLNIFGEGAYKLNVTETYHACGLSNSNCGIKNRVYAFLSGPDLGYYKVGELHQAFDQNGNLSETWYDAKGNLASLTPAIILEAPISSRVESASVEIDQYGNAKLFIEGNTEALLGVYDVATKTASFHREFDNFHRDEHHVTLDDDNRIRLVRREAYSTMLSDTTEKTENIREYESNGELFKSKHTSFYRSYITPQNTRVGQADASQSQEITYKTVAGKRVQASSSTTTMGYMVVTLTSGKNGNGTILRNPDGSPQRDWYYEDKDSNGRPIYKQTTTMTSKYLFEYDELTGNKIGEFGIKEDYDVDNLKLYYEKDGIVKSLDHYGFGSYETDFPNPKRLIHKINGPRDAILIYREICRINPGSCPA